MENKEVIKETIKTGNAGKIAGIVTIGLAVKGLYNTGKDLIHGVGTVRDKVFPAKEREDITYVPEEETEK